MRKLPILPTIIGTGFGSGFWPWGPGTAGSIVGVVIWYVLSLWLSCKDLLLVTLSLTIFFTLVGTWATAKLQPFWGNDPRRVVIDEIVGVWIPLLVVPPGNILLAFLSLVVFRLFDIFKPLGIRALDRHKGAFYVMADDLLAGIYSLVIVVIVGRWVL